MEPVEALEADGAAVAVVGAGGKKTTLYHLAERVDRAVVTSTVRIPIFDESVHEVVVTDDPVAAVTGRKDASFPLGVVPEQEREDRYRGYDPAVVDELIDAHDGSVLIKADGARFREFKAPGAHEPQLPVDVDVVVPIASAAIVDEPLTDELVHRPKQVVSVAEAAGIDIAVGDPVPPAVVGAVLASEHGGCRDVPPGAAVIPVINKVDDEGRVAEGREIAKAISEHHHAREPSARPALSTVVLARMLDGKIIETVTI